MKFILEPNQLAIRMEGMEKLWALKSQLQIPQRVITQIDYTLQTPAVQDFKGFFRFPGTSLPWTFVAGSYARRGTREFWYVHMHQSGVLTLTLNKDAFNYGKVRVTCTPEIAQNVADWWQEHK